MNNELVQTILTNFFAAILSVISAQYFFSSFFSRKSYNRIVTSLLYLLSTALFFISLQLVTNRSLNMLLLSVSILIITMLFSTHWFNHILFTLLFVVISTVCEFIVGMFIMLLFSIDFANLQEGIVRLGGLLFSKVLALILFAILRIRKHRSLFGEFRKKWGTICILPATTLFIMIIQYYIMYTYVSNKALQTYILICMCCLVICNVFVFRFIDALGKSSDIEQKLAVADNLLKEQERQYAIIVDNQQQFAKIQHDYKNILLGIQSELICERYTEATKYIQSQIILLSPSSSVISGNRIIDTIVNTKMTTARENGIMIDFQFRNIRNIKIDSIDLSILLGNALDNAIEATSKVLHPHQKTITLLIVMKENILNIIIKNPVVKSINVDHLETEKKDKRLHGYGIINMRTIVSRYGGSIIFTCQDLCFGTTILLPNKLSTAVNNE